MFCGKLAGSATAIEVTSSYDVYWRVLGSLRYCLAVLWRFQSGWHRFLYRFVIVITVFAEVSRRIYINC